LGVVPASKKALALYPAFGDLLSLQQAQGKSSQYRQVLWHMALAHTAVILAKSTSNDRRKDAELTRCPV